MFISYRPTHIPPQVRTDMGNPTALASWNATGNINPCGSPVWTGVKCSGGFVTVLNTGNTKFPNGPPLSPSLSAVTTLTTITMR